MPDAPTATFDDDLNVCEFTDIALMQHHRSLLL